MWWLFAAICCFLFAKFIKGIAKPLKDVAAAHDRTTENIENIRKFVDNIAAAHDQNIKDTIEKLREKNNAGPDYEEIMLSNTLEILQNIDKNEPGWEFILLSEIYNADITKSEDLKREYENNLSPNRNVPYINPTETFHLLSLKIRELSKIIAPIEHIIEVECTDAIGPPGTPGDANKIIIVAKKLVRIYRNLYKWGINDFSSFTVNNDIQNLFLETKKLCLSPITDMEKFNEDMKEEIIKLRAKEINSIHAKLVLNNYDILRYHTEYNKIAKLYNLPSI